ncbi:unnamed protein product [Cyprideis torosa]|uniref:Uncharacterized protein n=1 Tax=Cyprideis torosa TaxID=163714 RepID=A0A7R8WFK9_9CRUS|nr:unnamed protein product [Cyprideis torosa]CAG0895535.1 unnamed protein product [Cyprideis torosa]
MTEQVVHEGWLVKSPPPKSFFHAKWRRRWFVLRESGKLPRQYILEYFADQNKKKAKGIIDLDECEQRGCGLTGTVTKLTIPKELRFNKNQLISSDRGDLRKQERGNIEERALINGKMLVIKCYDKPIHLLPTADVTSPADVLEHWDRRQEAHVQLPHPATIDASLSFRKHLHIFSIYTRKRVFYLSACSETDMAKWVECLCQVCGLKQYTPTTPPVIGADGTDSPARNIHPIYANGPSPNLPPLSATTQITTLGSPSPQAPLSSGRGSGSIPTQTPSSVGLPNALPSPHGSPYIPISECRSGKRSDQVPGAQTTPASQGSWSTYPRTNTPKDHSGGGAGPAVAPVYVNASPDIPLPPKSQSARRATQGTVFTFDGVSCPPPVNRGLKPSRSPLHPAAPVPPFGVARVAGKHGGMHHQKSSKSSSIVPSTSASSCTPKISFARPQPPRVDRSLKPSRRPPPLPTPFPLESPPRSRRPIAPATSHHNGPPSSATPGRPPGSGTAANPLSPALGAPSFCVPSSLSLSAKLKGNQQQLQQRPSPAISASSRPAENGHHATTTNRNDEEEIFHYIINGRIIPESEKDKFLAASDVKYASLDFPTTNSKQGPSSTSRTTPAEYHGESPVSLNGRRHDETDSSSSRTQYKLIDAVRTMAIHRTKQGVEAYFRAQQQGEDGG